jgi:hypothetical protein
VEHACIKNRRQGPSPFAVWCLLWVTLGVYWFYWMFRMMGNINSLLPKPVYNMKKIGIAMGVFIFVYLSIFLSDVAWMGYIPIDPDKTALTIVFALVTLMFLMAVAWIVGLVYLHLHICKKIQTLEKLCGVKQRASRSLTVVFFFLFFIHLPYLQSHYSKCEALLCDRPISPT